VDKKRWQRFQNKLKNIDSLKSYLKNTRLDGLSLWEHLRQPNNPVAKQLAENPDVKNIGSNDVLDAVTIDAKYEGYLVKQQRLVANLQTLENKKIPPDLDVNKIMHLRAEAKEKLSAFGPATLGQASRIGGITPADITVIQIHLKKYSRTEISNTNNSKRELR
jgi:tRNA uridine 5-carboxymethylaminomethyl modification enzyme